MSSRRRYFVVLSSHVCHLLIGCFFVPTLFVLLLTVCVIVRVLSQCAALPNNTQATVGADQVVRMEQVASRVTRISIGVEVCCC